MRWPQRILFSWSSHHKHWNLQNGYLIQICNFSWSQFQNYRLSWLFDRSLFPVSEIERIILIDLTSKIVDSRNSFLNDTQFLHDLFEKKLVQLCTETFSSYLIGAGRQFLLLKVLTVIFSFKWNFDLQTSTLLSFDNWKHLVEIWVMEKI